MSATEVPVSGQESSASVAPARALDPITTPEGGDILDKARDLVKPVRLLLTRNSLYLRVLTFREGDVSVLMGWYSTWTKLIKLLDHTLRKLALPLDLMPMLLLPNLTN
jgi:hypothetical protein